MLIYLAFAVIAVLFIATVAGAVAVAKAGRVDL